MGFSTFPDPDSQPASTSTPITLAYAQIVANQTGITTTPADVTGLSVSVVVAEGRRIRVSAFSLFQKRTALGWTRMYIYEGATALAESLMTASTDEYLTLSPAVVLTPTGGVHTYKINVDTSVNTTDLLANPGYPAYILVEDITGSSAPAPAATVPVGQIAYWEYTGGLLQVGTGAETDVPGASVNIVVPAGRVIRVTASLHLRSSGPATDLMYMRIREDGNNRGFGYSNEAGSTPALIQQVWSPTAGSHTIKITATRQSGSGNPQIYGGAGEPGFLLVEDISPTPTLARSAPSSTLGYAEVTAAQTGISTETDLTGLSVTVTVPAGRRLKITAKGRFASDATAAEGVGRIKEGATELTRWFNFSLPANSWLMNAGSVIISPSAGSHTYKLTGQKTSGSMDLYAASTSPAFILVEDITAVLWNGTTWSAGAIASEAWTPWASPFTNITVGSGTVAAAYVKIGRTVHYRARFALGSGSAVAANPSLSLPYAASSDYVGGVDVIGTAAFHDSGTADYNGAVRMGGTQSAGLIIALLTSGTYPQHDTVDSTRPFTWTSGDQLSVYGTYEAAS